MDREVRLCFAISCEKKNCSDEEKMCWSAIRALARGTQTTLSVASGILTVYDATRKRVESNGGITYDNRKPTKNITSLPRSALASCTPWNIRDGQARMHTPLPCAAGNCERVPETLLFVFPRREEACIRQDGPFLPLLVLAIRQPVRERLFALCR